MINLYECDHCDEPKRKYLASLDNKTIHLLTCNTHKKKLQEFQTIKILKNFSHSQPGYVRQQIMKRVNRINLGDIHEGELDGTKYGAAIRFDPKELINIHHLSKRLDHFSLCRDEAIGILGTPNGFSFIEKPVVEEGKILREVAFYMTFQRLE